MTMAIINENPALVKLVKALRKKHPDEKLKTMASSIFEKWAAISAASSSSSSSSASSSSSSSPSSAPAQPTTVETAHKPSPPVDGVVVEDAKADDDTTEKAPAVTETTDSHKAHVPKVTSDATAPKDSAADVEVPAAAAAAPAAAEPSSEVEVNPVAEAAAARAADAESKISGGGIEDKLREKVKNALRGKHVVSTVVMSS
jgi:hypothetical protein